MEIKNNVDVAQRKLFLEQKLRESGEEAKLEQYLKLKLIECGWKDELKNICKGFVTRDHQKEGIRKDNNP